MSNWNLAQVWETIADALPDEPALVQGSRRISWAALDRRADGVAEALLDAGLRHQSKVGLYLYNAAEYVEGFFAACKAGLVPFNTNYRYGTEELAYLWDNADAEAVVFHASFAERCADLRPRLPKVRLWLCVDDGEGERPDWTVDYEEAARSSPGRVTAPWGRSGDDILLLYTGGTTGKPKGVMWHQDDVFGRMNDVGLRKYPDQGTLADIAAALDGPGPRHVSACPLMHGTGMWSSVGVLDQGGSVAFLDGRRFDAVGLWDVVERERVQTIAIVGDAFARPMLDALDAAPGRWDLSSLVYIASSGVMWSQEVKAGLSRHLPHVLLSDAIASSESVEVARSVSGSGRSGQTARFRLRASARVLTDDWRDVAVGEAGRLAVAGRNPVGYYKDPERTAATFAVIDGVRYSVPGDFARREADGTITLLGRGSSCINTAGEKVFAEEVEEVIKTLPGVVDAAVIGLPDERFGQIVAAVVAAPGDRVSGDDVVRHTKERLAGFKAPRRIVVVDDLRRHENGKLDVDQLRALLQP